MKRLLIILALFIPFQNFAQINHGGKPLGFNKNLTTAINSTIQVYTTPVLDIQSFIAEDKITDQHKDIAWRFGIEQFVKLNLSNSGVWETLPNEGRVWRLKIKSPNAKTINLNYSAFRLPVGATFFVYNNNKRQVLGSFTHENNKASGDFSTSILNGDYVILEYFEPLPVLGKGIIEVSSVVHGYRNIFDKKLKAFGSSESCNVNAICENTFWENEIRSAVLILTAGNTRICSGALINNTLQNGTPYVLTAEHCKLSTSNIFMFNYQSPSCATDIDGPTTQTISGSITRAVDLPSDFFLAELSSVPPASYNVFYAGWSNLDVSPTNGTGIHFPKLDVKKISRDDDLIAESGYYSPGNDHWRVADWNSGTTESGSSGSPLFDQNHRIVGQLHGGDAACNNNAFDFYGKFSHSWDTDPLNSKQLKFWLDPGSSGAAVIDGYDPNGPTLTTDAVLLNISGIESYFCGDSITPKITIRNNGSNNLTSLSINYELDNGGVTTINWTGNLLPYTIDDVNLPKISISGGTHTFTASTTNPNSTTDENLSNDSASITFKSNDKPLVATLNLTTDNFGGETSWAVKDMVGKTLIESPGYNNVPGGEQITENLCLTDSCFTFILYDSFGDGYCCDVVNGEFQLLNAAGDTIAEDTSFSGSSISFPFCLTTATHSYKTLNNYFNVYPNPTEGIFTITSKQNETYSITIHDVVGKVVYQSKTNHETKINLTTVNSGIYFISIALGNEKVVKKLIVK